MKLKIITVLIVANIEKLKIEKAMVEILSAIGEDPQREGLLETPKRVAKAYEKLFSGYGLSASDIMTTFDGENYDEMIICKGIDFFSTCEHHLLPFFGQVSIGYIPSNKIVGLSKMPRLVEIFSRRLQNQERLTMQICEALFEALEPKGVGVVITGKHLCTMARGVEKQNSEMTTSAFRGLFKREDKTRSEFLNLISK